MKKIILCIIICVILLLIYGATRQPKVIGYEEYVVQSGDSIWSIASKRVPDTIDKRDYIADVFELNENLTYKIYIGQAIILPVYDK
jgi:LysM repeat protein